MEYKGYTATIEFDEDGELYHGEIVDVRAVITFQADNAIDLKAAQHASIENYLDWCAERSEKP